MTFPKKGSRSIVVEGITYRYITTGTYGGVTLNVEKESAKGQRLEAWFDYHFLSEEGVTSSGQRYTSHTPTIQVTPGMAAQVIRYGLEQGWTPDKSAKELNLGSVDDKVKLNFSSDV